MCLICRFTFVCKTFQFAVCVIAIFLLDCVKTPAIPGQRLFIETPPSKSSATILYPVKPSEQSTQTIRDYA